MLKTVLPQTLDLMPKKNSITMTDRITWWNNSNRGSFNWDLYKKIIDAKRYAKPNTY